MSWCPVIPFIITRRPLSQPNNKAIMMFKARGDAVYRQNVAVFELIALWRLTTPLLGDINKDQLG